MADTDRCVTNVCWVFLNGGSKMAEFKTGKLFGFQQRNIEYAQKVLSLESLLLRVSSFYVIRRKKTVRVKGNCIECSAATRNAKSTHRLPCLKFRRPISAPNGGTRSCEKPRKLKKSTLSKNANYQLEY